MEEQATVWTLRPAQKGFVAPISRRQLRDFFGNDLFGYITIVKRRFEGTKYYGAPKLAWEGVPLLVASFPNLVSFEEAISTYLSYRPRLSIFECRPEVLEALGDIDWEAAAFRPIQEAWENWRTTPLTGRLHNQLILGCAVENELRLFRTSGL